MILLFMAAAVSAPDCNNAMTQLDMNVCAGRRFAAADAEMNRQWKVTAAAMKDRDRNLDRRHDKRSGYFEALLKAQRAWLAYRDAHCISEGYGARGGSMEPMLVSGCKAKLTTDRTGQLRELVETR